MKEGYRPEINKDIPKSYLNLITSCWNDDPNKRPSFDSILDRLRTDDGFITEKIDKEKYHKYINYIDNHKVSFDEFKIVNIFEIY